MNRNTKKTPRFKLRTLIALVVAAAIIGTGSYLYISHRHTSTPVATKTYTPPSAAEQDAGTTQKQEIVQQKATATAATPGAATVVIVDASQYTNPDSSVVVEVRSFISNVIESTGTCTVTLTQGSTTLTRTATATADATTTQCGTVDVPRSQFPSAGTWNVTVNYSSPTSTGSATTTAKVT